MNDTSGKPEKSQLAVWIPIVVSLAALIGGGTTSLYDRHRADVEREAEAERLGDAQNDRLLQTLFKIQTELADTKVIYTRMQLDGSIDPNFGALQSYVSRAERDGAMKNALMFSQLTDLVQKDGDMVAILGGYRPCILSDDFRTGSAEFVEHANYYVENFRTLPSVVAAKALVPGYVPFPSAFPKALDKEIKTRQTARFHRIPGCIATP